MGTTVTLAPWLIDANRSSVGSAPPVPPATLKPNSLGVQRTLVGPIEQSSALSVRRI